MRGEQLLSIVKNGELVKFNSRPCGRGDIPWRAFLRASNYFNSRPCGRGDPGAELSPGYISSYFNSRPCGRGDRSPAPSFARLLISIHAPAGGATYPVCAGSQRHQYFNSRPCGRGDRSSERCCSFVAYFNSRPCGRGDRSSERCCSFVAYFNSRPCGRGDGRLYYLIQTNW